MHHCRYDDDHLEKKYINPSVAAIITNRKLEKLQEITVMFCNQISYLLATCILYFKELF